MLQFLQLFLDAPCALPFLMLFLHEYLQLFDLPGSILRFMVDRRLQRQHLIHQCHLQLQLLVLTMPVSLDLDLRILPQCVLFEANSLELFVRQLVRWLRSGQRLPARCTARVLY